MHSDNILTTWYSVQLKESDIMSENHLLYILLRTLGVANHIVVVQCPSQQNRTIRATWWARSKTPSY